MIHHEEECEDSRQYRRQTFEVQVTLESQDTFWAGFSANISEGGVFISSELAQEVGDEVNVLFTPPRADKPIQVRGIVRWIRVTGADNVDAPPGLGIEFIDLPAEIKQTINGFLNERPPLFFEASTGRAHRRVNFKTEVSLNSRSGRASGTTVNISEAGALVLAKHDPEVGDAVRLRMVPPGLETQTEIESIVRWAKPSSRPAADGFIEFGVEFRDLAPSIRNRMRDFLAKRPPAR